MNLLPIQSNTYRIGTELSGLKLPETLDRLLNRSGVLPEQVETLRLDAQLGFTAPWDLRAIEEARPQITDVALSDLSLMWGEVLFQATGDLVVDTAGRPEGEISIRAVEWERMLEMAVAGGVLDPGLARSVERGLNLLAGLSGRSDTLDATLTFSNGLMRLGPVPIGPAPRLILR